MTTFTTAALCDAYFAEGHVQIAEPIFKCYGGNAAFCGRIATLKVFENDELIIATLAESADGRVLVIDGGGSHHCALLDRPLLQIAVANGWQGVIVYGCIRDTALLDALPIGIRALHGYPLKPHKKAQGDRGALVTFAGVNFKKDHYLYADADGMIVSETALR